MGLVAVPVTLRQAQGFVDRCHRHHRASVGHKFSVGAKLDGELVGVAIAGRPVSRHLDDGLTLEINRVATDGTKNACSFLYGVVRRVGREMGYTRFVTYTLPEEGGASLRAAGWRLHGEAGGGSWNCTSRKREDKHPTQGKLRWEWEPDG